MFRRFGAVSQSAARVTQTSCTVLYRFDSFFTAGTSLGSVRPPTSFLHIGDVKVPIVAQNYPERVPNVLSRGCRQFFPMSPETKAALRWMAQKELLGQDMCLIGEPGPLRRWLALTYCHYAKREVQLLCLSRDTTEADIKQRKEISNGSLAYVHQAAVQAALNGQVLVIEGLERAERNVLPVINNLLENREMHLDDGRCIIHPRRYDQLLQEHKTANLDHLGLLRCSERFCVIGLTVPVPKFPGNPLDPPLRSRFQSFYIHQQLDQTTALLAADPNCTAGNSIAKLRASLLASDVGGSDADRKLGIAQIGAFEAINLWEMCKMFPKESPGLLCSVAFPWELLSENGSKADLAERLTRVSSILKRYNLLTPGWKLATALSSAPCIVGQHKSVLTKLEPSPSGGTARCTFATGEVIDDVPTGDALSTQDIQNYFNAVLSGVSGDPSDTFVMTSYHHDVITEIIQSHCARRHIVLVGDAGCGKSAIIREFADLFGYQSIEWMHLYSDMSTRDLLQRRVTCPTTGDTRWELSPLMNAARSGRLAVLDGVDNLPPGMLAVMQELFMDQTVTMHDGTIFKSSESYNALKSQEGLDDEGMARRGIFAVHPSFRVIATAKAPQRTKSAASKSFWLTSDVSSMFNVVQMRGMPTDCAKQVLVERCAKEKALRGTVISDSALERVATTLLTLQQSLQALQVTDPKIPQLTMRQVLQVALYGVSFPDDLSAAVESAILLPLVATVTRTVLRDAMHRSGIVPSHSNKAPTHGSKKGSGLADFFGLKSSSNQAADSSHSRINFSIDEHGCTRMYCLDSKKRSVEIFCSKRKYSAAERALVPHVTGFVPNAQQDEILSWIGKHLTHESRMLLVGTQGVGKNKVVDYFLMSAGLPRHYLQLHRDTTVGSLTVNPTVVNGKIVWEDSPLVKAVRYGHVLVIDEIDKAPVEVVQILKGLVEDREMYLSDGRRIVSSRAFAAASARGTSQDLIEMSADFRIIVLANPPGYPFHGNDFYRVCGDLFSTFVMQNPDPESQLRLLSKTAPTVPVAILQQLITVFSRLTKLCEEGTLTYPFSLRELIGVVKHLQAYPHDGVYQALNNVFNFDLLDDNTMNHVRRILHESLNKDVLKGTQFKSELSPAIPLRVKRNVLESSQLFDDATPAHAVPIHCWDTVALSRFPSQSIVPMDARTLTSRVERYTAEQMRAVAPKAFSEVKLQVSLPFLDNDPSARVLKNVITSSDLLIVLFTSKALEERGQVGIAALTVPGRELVQHHNAPLVPPYTAVITEISLRCISPSAQSHTIELFAHDPFISVALCAGSSAKDAVPPPGFGRSVMLFDTCSASFTFVDVLRSYTQDFVVGELATESDVLDHNVDTPGAAMSTNGAQSCCMIMSLHEQPGHPISERVNQDAIGVNESVGVVHYVFAGSNCARVMLDSSGSGSTILTLTFPGEIRSLSFLSPNVFHVQFAKSMEGRNQNVIGKISFAGSTPQCSIRYLTSVAERALALGVGGVSFVGTRPEFRKDADIALLSASLAVEARDIEGAISVPANGSSFSYAVVGTGGMVDSYSLPDNSSAEGKFVVSYDSIRGQLLSTNLTSGAATLFDTRLSNAHRMPTGSAVTAASNTSLAATVNGTQVTSFDRDYEKLSKEFEAWKGLLDGQGGGLGAPPTPKELDMWYSEPRKKPSGTLKHGKEDPDNTPHVGGNTWAGGTGGTDTAGLGGLVGPYRLDKGHTVHQVSPEAKKNVPQHIIDEARRMGQQALKERLKEIGMSDQENAMYSECLRSVQGPIIQLQNMLSGLKAHEGERVWVRNQSDGVWDDAKVVEGITGERNIYKRRAESQDPNALQHKKKKRLLFVLDVSASMYRFNGMDQRLNRLVESAIMVMEALIGQEDKIEYAIVGHNGDSDELPLVQFGAPPRNKKERIDVCLKMVAYAQYCWSGDNTVNAMRKSLATVTSEEADSYFVFVVSDANLAQYGISPTELARIIRLDERVNMFCIFIASFGQQSSYLQSKLPAGHGFECFDTKQLPLVMGQIFTSTSLLGGI